MHQSLQIVIWCLVFAPVLLARPFGDQESADADDGFNELELAELRSAFDDDDDSGVDGAAAGISTNGDGRDNEKSAWVTLDKGHDMNSEPEFIAPWNTLTICTVIAAITFVLVWVIFWLIFHTESAEFQKSQHIHKKGDKFRNCGAGERSQNARADHKKPTSSDTATSKSSHKKKSKQNQKHTSPKNCSSAGGSRVAHSIALMPLPRILESNGNGNGHGHGHNGTGGAAGNHNHDTHEYFMVESCDDVAVQCEDEDVDVDVDCDCNCDCDTFSSRNVDNLSNINLYQGSSVGTISHQIQLDGSFETIPIHTHAQTHGHAVNVD